MFERGLGFEVGSAGQTTGDVSDKQIMGFRLFDLLRYFCSPQHTDSALEVEGRLGGRGARVKVAPSQEGRKLAKIKDKLVSKT